MCTLESVVRQRVSQAIFDSSRERFTELHVTRDSIAADMRVHLIQRGTRMHMNAAALTLCSVRL